MELDDRPWKHLNALLSRVSSLEHLAKRIGSALESKDSHKRPAVLGEVEEEVAETEEALSSTSESPSKAFNILNTDSSWAIKIECVISHSKKLYLLNLIALASLQSLLNCMINSVVCFR